MNGTTVRQEADKILAELPDRIRDVIKPFACQSPDHPALVHGDVTWIYADLADIVASTAITLTEYCVPPGSDGACRPQLALQARQWPGNIAGGPPGQGGGYADQG